MNWNDILQLDKDKLKEYTSNRMQMRLKFPGIMPWIFEAQLKFIVKLVIGWDVDKECATKHDGFLANVKHF